MEDLPNLAEMAKPWIERLRLADWNIQWNWARYHELPDKAGGHLAWNQERRSAEIKILVPNDEAPGGVHVPTEEYVVHELLHIVFAMLDDDLNDTAHTLFERALNATASAFVELAGG